MPASARNRVHQRRASIAPVSTATRTPSQDPGSIPDLSAVFEQSEEKHVFHAPKFFQRWFRELGQPYYFLFRKNLSVTNIQFGELLALLRCHTYDTEWRGTRVEGALADAIHFVSHKQFYEAISGIVSAFPKGEDGRDYGLIQRRYGSLIHHTIVVDAFYGSAAVFVPPTLQIDLRRICAESGYIHSCGKSVYIRNVEKARTQEFLDSIDHHTSRKRGGSFLSPYANEYFSHHDRELSETLRDGLDEVKLDIHKHYMDQGQTPLPEVLDKLAKTRHEKLLVAEPRDFQYSRESFKPDGADADDTTMWLILERGMPNRNQPRDDRRFYVCYDQQFKNENPFHLFDENKPGWVAPTTIPHSLGGAMLNLTRPWGKTSTSILDPFVGTGTLAFEALKFENVRARGGDTSRLAREALLDNVTFFCMNAAELRSLHKWLEPLATSDVSWSKNQEQVACYDAAMTLVKALKIDGHRTKEAHVLMRIRRAGFRTRVLLYLALRALYRQHADPDDAYGWPEAFRRELRTLSGQLDYLARQRQDQQHSSRSDGILQYRGKYSNCLATDPEALAKKLSQPDDIFVIQDVRSLAARRREGRGDPGKYDVIISDPPYGLNAPGKPHELSELYSDAVRAMVSSLRDGGHLVLALPERSYTGRKTPYFTHRQVVTLQVLAAIRAERRELVRRVQQAPAPRSLYEGPYYWEASKSLRRSIVHFQVRDKLRSEE